MKDRWNRKVRLRTATLAGALFFLSPVRDLAAAPTSTDLKMDHMGYRTADTKIAFFTANPGASVAIIATASGRVAYTIPSTAIIDEGIDSSSPSISGDHVWEVNFTSFQTPGTYTLYDANLNEQSYPFQISDNVYQAPLAAALKALYYARCGAPKTVANGGAWNDVACHAADVSSTAFCTNSLSYPTLNADYGILDLSGGWHDAGDYEKKIGYSAACGVTETGDNGDTLWYLLSAYELNPGLFGGLGLNLPESGDGLPDILNQAKWELEWYLRMQRPDGHVLEGVHCYNLGTLGSPPSSDTTQRGYNPPSFQSEAVFVAVVAHAARVFATLTAGQTFAATLKVAALTTWNNWVSISPNVDPNAPSYLPYLQFKVWAAAEIFRLDPTGPSGTAAKAVVDAYPNWATYAAAPAYVNYAIINYLQTAGATPATVAAMKTALGSLVGTLFADNDLYNSGMPSYQYSWGSNQNKADSGLLLGWAAQLGATGSFTTAQCVAHAEDFLHYFHGSNPLDMVYLTNTSGMNAGHCVWQIFNSWFGQYGTPSSQTDYIGKPASVTDSLYPYVAADAASSLYGPPPGYVPDGPTYQYLQLGGTDVPPNVAGPAQAPYAKSYRDYNRSFAASSQPWIVNEAGVYDIGAYAMLASMFAGNVAVQTPTPLSTPGLTLDNTAPVLVGPPSRGTTQRFLR